MTNSDEYKEPRRRKISVVGPVILIGLGIVLLLNNLGVISGGIWDVIWRLWPVLLVALGMEGILRREGVAFGVVVVGFGVLFLMSNYQYLALSVWELFSRLWPLLILALGVDIFIERSRSIWSALVGGIVILLVFLGSVAILGISQTDGTAIEGQQIQQPLGQTESAKLTIIPGAGSLNLISTSNPDMLIEGTVPLSSSGFQVNESYSTSNGTVNYQVSASGGIFIFTASKDNNWIWNLGVTPQIPIDLKVDLDAGDATVNLSDLIIQSVNVNLGVGQMQVILPEEGEFSGILDLNIGQIVVVVPHGAAVKLILDTGLSTTDVPDGFQKQDENTYITPNYHLTEPHIDLVISQAIGSIVIRHK